MSFLDKNIIECLSAKVTDLGRQRISEGNFNLKYFKVGDSEFDYNFNPAFVDSFILHSMEKDFDLKYPFLMDSQTKLDYGSISFNSTTTLLTENVSETGMMSGTSLLCPVDCFNINLLSGQTYITVSNTSAYTNCDFIVLNTQNAISATPSISANTLTFFYKILSINVSGNTLNLDRPTPNFSTFNGKCFVSCYNCVSNPWSMNIVWTEKPAGLDNNHEHLFEYGSSQYASVKEYFGYTSTSGQTNNTSVSYKNSFGETIVVTPDLQKTIAVIHYSGEQFDVYEDFIASTPDAISYFKLYLPYLLYHRSTGSTIGTFFYMSPVSGYTYSTKNNNIMGELYFYLMDEQGNNIGKIFVNKRCIVIDDQEICAALSYRGNRMYTLPAPKINYIPVDLPCSPDSGLTAILTGTTKDIWITYFMENEYDLAKNGMYCNYYSKLSGTTGASNISIKFGNEFQFLTTSALELSGFSMTRLFILAQIVDSGTLPSPDSWTKINITSQLTNHVDGTYIDPSMIVGKQFIITHSSLDSGSVYLLDDYIGATPRNSRDSLIGFGDEKVLPGSVTLTRGTNIHTMDAQVNLPASQFLISQNPTQIPGVTPVITEIGLYNELKELLVISKTSHPHTRISFQQFSIRIDF